MSDGFDPADTVVLKSLRDKVRAYEERRRGEDRRRSDRRGAMDAEVADALSKPGAIREDEPPGARTVVQRHLLVEKNDGTYKAGDTSAFNLVEETMLELQATEQRLDKAVNYARQFIGWLWARDRTQSVRGNWSPQEIAEALEKRKEIDAVFGKRGLYSKNRGDIEIRQHAKTTDSGRD